MNKNSNITTNKKRIIFIIIAIILLALSFFLGTVYNNAQMNKIAEEVFFEQLAVITNRLEDYLRTKEPSYLESAVYDIAFCERISHTGVVIENNKYDIAFVMRNLRLHLRYGELTDKFIERIIKELTLSYENGTIFYIDANIPIYG